MEALQNLAVDAMRALGEGSITVSSATRSMAPMLAGGEVLHWRRPAGTPRVGALLLFAQSPGLVVHRVIGGRPGALRTKGDGSAAPDGARVADVAVVGVIDAIERGGTCFDLDTRGARFHAGCAAGVSVAGWFLHALAWRADRLVTIIARRECRAFRASAFALQRGSQGLLHALLFRACHRARPVRPGTAPGAATAPESR